MRLCGTNFFALIAPVQPILHRVSCSNEMVPNAPKPYETHQNMSLGSDGMDSVDLLQKFQMQLCGLNFCINYNNSARFEASIVKQRNGPKCTQTLRNKTKHEFRVQWGGSGAFIAKNSYEIRVQNVFVLFVAFGCTQNRLVALRNSVHNRPN